MTFQQLLYVVEISACGSMNKAAQKLFLSQSCLSMSIRELEEELGFPIFARSNRGVQVTPKGEEFLSHAVSLIEQKKQIETLYKADHEPMTEIELSISTQRFPFAEAAFLKLLRKTDSAHVLLSYKEIGMDQVIDDVYASRADVGILYLTPLAGRLIKNSISIRGLIFEELISVTPSVYLRKGHPLAKKKILTAEDLQNYPYCIFERPPGTAVDFSEEYPMDFINRPTQNIVINSRANAMQVISASDAFATGSGLLTKDPAYRDIISVPLSDSGKLNIGYICVKEKPLSPIAETFLQNLNEAIRESVEYTETLRRGGRRKTK